MLRALLISRRNRIPRPPGNTARRFIYNNRKSPRPRGESRRISGRSPVTLSIARNCDVTRFNRTARGVGAQPSHRRLDREALTKHFSPVEISFAQGAAEYIEYFINGEQRGLNSKVPPAPVFRSTLRSCTLRPVPTYTFFCVSVSSYSLGDAVFLGRPFYSC